MLGVAIKLRWASPMKTTGRAAWCYGQISAETDCVTGACRTWPRVYPRAIFSVAPGLERGEISRVRGERMVPLCCENVL